LIKKSKLKLKYVVMEKHQELLIALRKVIRAIDLHSKHLSKTSGLTSPQLLILLEIDKISGVNSSQVAKVLI